MGQVFSLPRIVLGTYINMRLCLTKIGIAQFFLIFNPKEPSFLLSTVPLLTHFLLRFTIIRLAAALFILNSKNHNV